MPNASGSSYQPNRSRQAPVVPPTPAVHLDRFASAPHGQITGEVVQANWQPAHNSRLVFIDAERREVRAGSDGPTRVPVATQPRNMTSRSLAGLHRGHPRASRSSRMRSMCIDLIEQTSWFDCSLPSDRHEKINGRQQVNLPPAVFHSLRRFKPLCVASAGRRIIDLPKY